MEITPNPFNAFDANVLQVIEHAAIAQVDEQSGLAIPQGINIAGVGPDEQVCASRGSTGAKVAATAERLRFASIPARSGIRFMMCF